MFAYINAQKLVELAESQPERYTKEELLHCMANKAQILDVIEVPN